MHVRPVKPVIENDSEKELQQQNANEMHQTMKNCKKPIKQHRGQRKAHRPLKKAKSEKRGFFHFPIFHITCIIRNIRNQKIRPPFSSDFACGGLIAAYSCRCSLNTAAAFSLLGMRCRAFNSRQLRQAGHCPAAVCQSMHRWLRNKYVQSFCSRLCCQTVQHRLRSSQSTALPEPPDSLRLPVR